MRRKSQRKSQTGTGMRPPRRKLYHSLVMSQRSVRCERRRSQMALAARVAPPNPPGAGPLVVVRHEHERSLFRDVVLVDDAWAGARPGESAPDVRPQVPPLSQQDGQDDAGDVPEG